MTTRVRQRCAKRRGKAEGRGLPVSSRWGAVCLALAACALSAAAADPKAEYELRNAERYVALFTTLDRNLNGVVSRAEANGDLNFMPRFDEIDINRDGLVTGPELQRFVEQQHGLRVELMPPR